MKGDYKKQDMCRVDMSVRAASHYTILSLRRPAMAPHDAVADMTSCSVRPSAIESATILIIGGYLSHLPRSSTTTRRDISHPI